MIYKVKENSYIRTKTE